MEKSFTRSKGTTSSLYKQSSESIKESMKIIEGAFTVHDATRLYHVTDIREVEHALKLLLEASESTPTFDLTETS